MLISGYTRIKSRINSEAWASALIFFRTCYEVTRNKEGLAFSEVQEGDLAAGWNYHKVAIPGTQ
jgi:hypothetical protein